MLNGAFHDALYRVSLYESAADSRQCSNRFKWRKIDTVPAGRIRVDDDPEVSDGGAVNGGMYSLEIQELVHPPCRVQ